MKLHGGGSAQQEEGATEVHTGQLLWTTGVRLSTLQQPSVCFWGRMGVGCPLSAATPVW